MKGYIVVLPKNGEEKNMSKKELTKKKYCRAISFTDAYNKYPEALIIQRIE